ncbi:hypothetical protein QEH52_04095 [Coraliomargarita sp. SDUM461003]|uniref:Uncharacterized protein n=1 Tax=Thalassobacterium maritimum TaxID=3041265 RepID=A0ABU1AUP1_9BACT|nr:hypothetical protein [Coraliomargarita sp. SDUM461003]MDQ8206677.1 hypothetical protein [Coraliomargarita sp. SDUM461003]
MTDQNSEGWLEEIRRFEEIFGPRIYLDQKSSVTAEKGTRSFFQLTKEENGVGVKTVSDTIQGATMKPFLIYGLIPLLATRSVNFRKLWADIPSAIKTRYQVQGLPFTTQVNDRNFFSAALWPEEALDQSKSLLGHCMAISPDWTLACLSEIRATYSRRLDFMPELFMMGFRRSEMFSNDELGELLGKMYPSRWASVDVRERRKELRAKLQRIIKGK